MKKWLVLLFLTGGTSLSFAQYGSSSEQNYHSQQSESSSSYGNQQAQYQQAPSNSPCEHLKSKDPAAYAFSQKLSPVHQHVFCQQFTPSQQKQAMALVDIKDTRADSDKISPDMAVEIVMQTARYSKKRHNNIEKQQQPAPKASQSQGNSRSNRYSNY